MADVHLNEALIEKISALPPERIAEIEDFVDFLRSRDADLGMSRASLAASEPAFTAVWSNPEDDAYDAL